MQPKRKALEEDQPNTSKVSVILILIFQKRIRTQTKTYSPVTKKNTRQKRGQKKGKKLKEVQTAKKAANLAASLIKKKVEVMVNIECTFLTHLGKKQSEQEKKKKGK